MPVSELARDFDKAMAVALNDQPAVEQHAAGEVAVALEAAASGLGQGARDAFARSGLGQASDQLAAGIRSRQSGYLVAIGDLEESPSKDLAQLHKLVRALRQGIAL